MWPHFRMTKCQKSTCSADSAGNRYVNAGTINRDVSFEEKVSVEKKKIAASHTRTGNWYSKNRDFTAGRFPHARNQYSAIRTTTLFSNVTNLARNPRRK